MKTLSHLPSKAPVVVVGAGQAGLSVSWHLHQLGVEHIVLERGEPGNNWKTARWDNFCLVTPNWQCALPGYPYVGEDPDGFMVRDDIVAYLRGYAASFESTLMSGVNIELVLPDQGGFLLHTNAGVIRAKQVVVAVGGYHRALIPQSASRVPAQIVQIDSSKYRNSSQFPRGAVLVVGSGQSGAQIAEDLHHEGRRVHLSTGSARKASRRYRGRDLLAWLHDKGFDDVTIDERRAQGLNHRDSMPYLTGRDGGRDIDLRNLAKAGMVLHGRLDDINAGIASFRDDLVANLEAAEASNASIKASIDRYIDEQEISAPLEGPYVPQWSPSISQPLSLHLERADISTIIWCMGFESDFGWIKLNVFDPGGRPIQKRGLTEIEGLYFLGLPWQHTRTSARMVGVGRDAKYLAKVIAQRVVRRGAG